LTKLAGRGTIRGTDLPPVRHYGQSKPRVAKEGDMLERLYSSLTEAVDHRIGWHRLPWPFGMLRLVGISFRLRARNL
jgi:hypothetical protein